MLTKNLKRKINIITLGCSKNLVDSEVLMSHLKADGQSVVHDSCTDASIIIINTCGFIDLAKQESIDTILHYSEEKSKGNIEHLFVTGCLSERYKKELNQEIDYVDGWFGTMQLPELLAALQVDYKKNLLDARTLTTPSHYAYLKISEGCNRPCSFCAIPLMRGKHRSKSIEQLTDETQLLIDKGVKEILLIAQDSTYYGLDLYNKRALSTLLEKLSDISGLGWIRLHYAFPTNFPLDVIDIMKERANICNYLDIPLQHGSTPILKLMRRGTTREKTDLLLETIRNKIPDITLRTTLIVGHPNESEEDFQAMKDFVETHQFDRLGTFLYSHEEGTHAYQMADNVPKNVKEQRRDEIMEIQSNISYQKNLKKINTIQNVLIDRVQSNYYIGRTIADSPEVDNEVYIIDKHKKCKVGQFVKVKIDKADTFDLYGQTI